MDLLLSIEEIDSAAERLKKLYTYLTIEEKEMLVASLEEQTQVEGFWDDNRSAQAVLKEIKNEKRVVDLWHSADKEVQDIRDLYEMAQEEGDNDAIVDLQESMQHPLKMIHTLEFMRKMSGEDDACNALFTIHSGAGGTESCDWADILFRMYMRWFERNDFATEILEIQEGEEAGIKSVTIEVKGDYAFGYLNAETGVHRLVRISPFDSGARRHTSFASVHCTPIFEDDVEFELNENDIRVDTYRASGAGGQHVNKTDSAVRMTHIPTNIVVQCQNQRSQIKNRETALKMLKSRVRQHYKEEEMKKREDKMGEKKKIEWGSQIRSYVLHPYNMVKDHRTGYETSNTAAVLDGDITEFIERFLLET